MKKEKKRGVGCSSVGEKGGEEKNPRWRTQKGEEHIKRGGRGQRGRGGKKFSQVTTKKKGKKREAKRDKKEKREI